MFSHTKYVQTVLYMHLSHTELGLVGRVQSHTPQNRRMRCFLGNFVPISAIQQDIGWAPGGVQKKCGMIHLWNHSGELNELK